MMSNGSPYSVTEHPEAAMTLAAQSRLPAW